MASPVYFLAHASMGKVFPADIVDRRELARFGLSDVFRDVDSEKGVDWYASEATTGSGPGGKPGLYVCALPVVSRELPRALSYNAADATFNWSQITDETWIGLDTTNKTKPADVARRQQQEGHWIKLNDGQEWLVPAVRRPEVGDKTITDEQGERVVRVFTAGVPRVNQQLRYDCKARKVIATVRPIDQRLWDWSAKFYNLVYRDEPIAESDVPDMAEQFEFCAELLGVNYRLGIGEINELGLVTEADIVSIIQATVDFPWYRSMCSAAAAKKN